jgi:hypothetical protein
MVVTSSPCLDVIVRKAKSPYCQDDEIGDAIIALIFNKVTVEKTNPTCPPAVTREEEEEINL